MKPYRPNNKITSTGFIWLLLSSLLGGVTVGGLTLAVSNVIYPIIIAPLLMGGTASIANLLGIKFGKVRHPLYASIFAALCGTIVYGSFRFGEYLQFKQEFKRQVKEQLDLATETSAIDLDIDSLIDSFLIQETGSTGFWGYLQYEAEAGIEIVEFGKYNGIQLDRNFTWFYWFLEIALIQMVMLPLAYYAASQPFCEKCQRWYGRVEKIGYVDLELSPDFLSLLERKNFTRAGELIENKFFYEEIPSLQILYRSCSSCKNNDSVLIVNQNIIDREDKQYSQEVVRGVISPKQKSQLLAAVKQENEDN